MRSTDVGVKVLDFVPMFPICNLLYIRTQSRMMLEDSLRLNIWSIDYLPLKWHLLGSWLSSSERWRTSSKSTKKTIDALILAWSLPSGQGHMNNTTIAIVSRSTSYNNIDSMRSLTHSPPSTPCHFGKVRCDLQRLLLGRQRRVSPSSICIRYGAQVANRSALLGRAVQQDKYHPSISAWYLTHHDPQVPSLHGPIRQLRYTLVLLKNLL